MYYNMAYDLYRRDENMLLSGMRAKKINADSMIA